MTEGESSGVKIEEYIGDAHRIYCDINGNAINNLLVDREKSSGKRKFNSEPVFLDSILMRYRRNHTELRTTVFKPILNINESVSDAQNRQIREEAVKKQRKEDHRKFVAKSNQHKVGVWSRMECFFLNVFPTSAFSVMLKAMNENSNNNDTVLYAPMDPTHLQGYLQYLTFDKSRKVECAAVGDQEEVHGRELTWKSVESTVSAINELHDGVIGPLDDPMKSSSVKEVIVREKKQYIEKRQAPAFDPVLTLPKLHEYNQRLDKSSIQKLRDWTIMLLSFPLLARVSEFCEFCPVLEHVKLPTELKDWDDDGYPQYVLVGLTDWKHRSAKDKNLPCWYYVYRNKMHLKYCPVYHLLLWLSISELKQGPIFTKIKNGLPLIAHHVDEVRNPNAALREEWKTAEGTTVNISYMEWSKIVRELFDVIAEGTGNRGFKSFTPHSFRRTACLWAARCGAKQCQILAAGRWSKNSGSFYEYIKEGCLESERRYPNPADDPIRSLWVFHPVVLNANIDK